MHLIATLAACALFVAVATSAQAADTTVSLGSALGLGLELVVATVAAPLLGLVGLWLQRQARRLGIEITDADRARLNALIENGVLWAVDNAGAQLDGKWSVDLRSEILSGAAAYMQAYGADTLKRLKAPADPAQLQQIILPRLLKMTGGASVG